VFKPSSFETPLICLAPFATASLSLGLLGCLRLLGMREATAYRLYGVRQRT
jgi:hypothetical protein